MKRKNSIVLIGFMGCGKTSVGVKLSYRMRMSVVDTDKLIEQQEKRSVSKIFADEGEQYFRVLETKLLEALSERPYKYIYSVVLDSAGLLLSLFASFPPFKSIHAAV